MPRPTLLIVEDSPSLALTYAEFLGNAGYDIISAETAADARRLAMQNPALILLDLHLPDGSGLDLLRDWRAAGVTAPVVVITAETGAETAVAAIRAGASDFISKPVTRERLTLTVRNTLEQQSLKNTVAALSAFDRDGFCGMIGRSPQMQLAWRTIESAAQSRAPVFITGESGTGKELAALALHASSPRRAQHFEAINCAAMPANLIESEVFGHAKGAFTGALAAHTGAALRADRGTLFLDELTEMPQDLQPKLLRFTQTGVFRPVGGEKEQAVDVRFVAATNRDPHKAISDGKLREDLYYRLNVIHIHLPPLRERGDDGLMIAARLLARLAAEEGKHFHAIDDDVRAFILSNAWPGNVRQLENCLRRAVVLHDGEILTMDMIPPPAEPLPAVPGQPTFSGIIPLREMERLAIEHALRACAGNVSEAARRLEINPSTIHRKITQWRHSNGI